jgi:hypothetical protein
MILPELEPQSDFTFEIKDVQIKENSLTFTIHKKNEKQQCTLQKQESSQYLGTCKSDVDVEGVMLIDISMSPPVVIEKDVTKPESVVSP